jgi:hypothetical protein
VQFRVIDPTPEPLPLPPIVAPGERSRKIQWIALVVLLFVPAVLLGAFLVILLVLELASFRSNLGELIITILPWPTAVVTAILFARAGLRRGWHTRKVLIGGWVFLVLGVLAIVGLAVPAFIKVRDSSRLKAMLPRQPAAALAEFFLENPGRIFVRYDEIVGPGQYLKSHNDDYGNISFQFPLRRAFCDTLPVRLPDGSTVQRTGALAAISKDGLVATYPFPEDDKYKPARVYLLDCGVSLRDWHVVNLPPDPAGREGRDQNGVHTYQLPDGRRFEITYRGGVPDGPFRAYQADGAPWGEATYRNGHVVEAWLITRDGRKFDELKDGEAAEKAVSDSLVAGKP